MELVGYTESNQWIRFFSGMIMKNILIPYVPFDICAGIHIFTAMDKLEF